jgi:hypothetical protein
MSHPGSVSVAISTLLLSGGGIFLFFKKPYTFTYNIHKDKIHCNYKPVKDPSKQKLRINGLQCMKDNGCLLDPKISLISEDYTLEIWGNKDRDIRNTCEQCNLYAEVIYNKFCFPHVDRIHIK